MVELAIVDELKAVMEVDPLITLLVDPMKVLTRDRLGLGHPITSLPSLI